MCTHIRRTSAKSTASRFAALAPEAKAPHCARLLLSNASAFPDRWVHRSCAHEALCVDSANSLTGESTSPALCSHLYAVGAHIHIIARMHYSDSPGLTLMKCPVTLGGPAEWVGTEQPHLWTGHLFCDWIPYFPDAPAGLFKPLLQRRFAILLHIHSLVRSALDSLSACGSAGHSILRAVVLARRIHAVDRSKISKDPPSYSPKGWQRIVDEAARLIDSAELDKHAMLVELIDVAACAVSNCPRSS
jgi:hypothetical protein